MDIPGRAGLLFLIGLTQFVPALAQPKGLHPDIPRRALAIGAIPPPALPVARDLAGLEAALDNGTPVYCLTLLDRQVALGYPSPADTFPYAYLRAMALIRQEEIDSALAVCAQLSQLAGTDPARRGWAHLAEAKARHARLQFQTTYRLAGSALALARTSRDPKLEQEALALIGRVSRDIYMTLPERSAPYHEQALAIAKTLRDTAFILAELTALSLDYLDRSDPGIAQGYLEEAIGWIGPASSLRSRFLLVRQAAFFWDQFGDPEQSYTLYEQAVRLAKFLGLRSSTQNLYEQMAGIRMKQGAWLDAQSCLDSAARYSTWKRELGYFYRSFGDVALARGERDSAIFYYQKAFEEQVKGYSNRNTLQLAEWETEFRTREAEQALEAQQRKRRWLITLVALISGLLLVSGVGWYWQYRNRREIERQNKLIEAQKEALFQLDEAKNRLFANISHELRTPLTLMLGPLEQLADTGNLNAAQTAMLRLAQTNGRHMLAMIQQILDLGKLEAGKLELEEKPLALAEFLRQCTAAFSGHAKNRGVRLEWHTAISPALVVWLDAPKMETILNNLVSNALKYTPPGGVVTVAASDLGERFRVEVRDTGRGIAAEDLPHVFDRYFQSRQINAPVEGGTGLGLAICLELSKLLGGRLEAESEPGKGSRFRLEWPKRLAMEAATRVAGQTEVLHQPEQPPLPVVVIDKAAPVIVLVDDNPEMRRLLRSMLEPRYQVVEAAHGREALDVLPDVVQHPAWQQYGGLVLTDLMMPVLDGFGLLQALKSTGAFAQIPVIVLSARAGVQQELALLQVGIDDYLLKPFQQDELLARIQFLLERQQARRLPEPGLEHDLPLEVGAAGEPLPELPTREWLLLLEKAALKHLGEHDFNLSTLSEAMGLSSRTLQRRLKTETGLTATQYLQELRFQQARLLLETAQVDSVKALSLAIGMRDVKYFSQGFKKRFGKSPSAYLS
ncbi:MAG: response regulator [Saprospiraceae bacterium]|nr:response regulator [Saprospiraceae bacterium]